MAVHPAPNDNAPETIEDMASLLAESLSLLNINQQLCQRVAATYWRSNGSIYSLLCSKQIPPRPCADTAQCQRNYQRSVIHSIQFCCVLTLNELIASVSSVDDLSAVENLPAPAFIDSAISFTVVIFCLMVSVSSFGSGPIISLLKKMSRATLSTACTLFNEKRRNSWLLTEEDTMRAVALMEADGLTADEMADDLRAFLYAKGIMQHEIPAVRKLKFDSLLKCDAIGISIVACNQLKAARERLSRIVVKGENGSNLNGRNLFVEFSTSHPEWNAGCSFVVFRDHIKLIGKPHAYVERVQPNGFCYMHAPVVLQHYLVAMNTQEAVPMLDMAVYLKKFMSAEALERRIWHDQGGDSKMFLKSILAQDEAPLLISRTGEFKFTDMKSCLESFGPGLVSGFEVERVFDSASWQHLGRRHPKIEGLHAMVLVGVRQQGDQARFLIQNWWKNKAFVEVDGEYLNSCGATVYFVRTPQLSMGDYPANAHGHVECEMLDAQETFASEISPAAQGRFQRSNQCG